MSRIFSAIGTFSVRFRWPIVIAWVLVTVVSVRALPGLADVAKDAQSSFLPASSPSVQELQLAQSVQDSKHGVGTMVGARDASAITPADLQQINAVESKIRAVNGVVRVQDFGLSPDARARQAQVVTNLPPFGGGTAA